MLTCALMTHVKELKIEILSKKLCQFILLEIEKIMFCNKYLPFI